MRHQVVGVSGLDRLGHPLVQPAPACRGQLGVQRLANKAVAEAETARGAGFLADDARPDRLVQCVEEFVRIARELRNPLEHLELEMAPDHRGHGQGPVGGVRQPRHAAADHFADAVRDLKLVERVLGPPLAIVGIGHPRLAEMT